MRLASGAAAAITVLAAAVAVPVCAALAHPASVTLAASSVAAQAAAPAAPGMPAAPAAGNPAGHAFVPAAARAVNTSHPTRVVGHGTAASCTSRAVVAAVAKGGVITFSCGRGPVTIKLTATATVRNSSRRVVLDGGGKVTLSGGGARRILYMNTCDIRAGKSSSHCYDEATPQLTVQNLTFEDGNSTGHHRNIGGGGAIFALGGRLKVVNSRFIGNRCDRTGPDLGGAAIRAYAEYRSLPVYVVHSTFRGGVCSNGGALSSIGVTWRVLNSVMTGNKAIGWGANPAQQGTPGGGSGGAIYTDGDKYTVTVAGTVVAGNHAREGGGAIFFVSNNRTGTLRIEHSALHRNPSAGFETAGYPGIFFHGRGKPMVLDSTLS
jgi:hypothetical protein